MTLMLDQRKVTGRRVIAFLVDTLLGFVIFWSLVRALGTEVETRPGTHLTMFFNITGSQASGELAGTVYELEGASLAVVLLVAMSYWIGMLVVLQGLTGRTLGKVVAGIRTVNAEGRPCGLGRAAVRWLFLAVDAFPYVMPMLVGFVVTVASSNRQRVGDLVAGTWVVSRDAAGEPIPTGTAREKAPSHDAPSRSGFYDPPD